MIIEVSADDLFLFTDIADTTIRLGTAGDTLIISESILCNFPYGISSDHFLFADVAICYQSIITAAISDVIVLADELVKSRFVESINDFLFLYDIFQGQFSPSILDILNFSENLVNYSSIGLQLDILEFSELLTYTIISIRHLSENLSLSDHCVSILINDLITQIPVGFPDLSSVKIIHLIDSVENLSIDNPTFGDSDTIVYQRLNKRTRGYTPIIEGVGRVPMKSKKMTFNYLCQREVDRIRTFWKRNVGRPVTFTDMYEINYTVILQNPESDFAQVGRESRTLTMDFYIL